MSTLAHNIMFNNSSLTLPPLFSENNNVQWTLTITARGDLLTKFGTTRQWKKHFTSVGEAAKEAEFRWKRKLESNQMKRVRRPCLEPADYGTASEKNKYTLHPMKYNSTKLICFWREGIRSLAHDVDGLFFLDPVSLNNIRSCQAFMPHLTFIATYEEPNLYIINGFEKKNDTWCYRRHQLQDAVKLVNHPFLKMQPTIVCSSREELDAHLQLYKLEKINHVEVRRYDASYGNEQVSL